MRLVVALQRPSSQAMALLLSDNVTSVTEAEPRTKSPVAQFSMRPMRTFREL